MNKSTSKAKKKPTNYKEIPSILNPYQKKPKANPIICPIPQRRKPSTTIPRPIK